ncbi:MAG: hypothetical protein WBJ10_02040 [Daejeonella sp.]|uniref:hypothetical protein n=1 Tax=Daejeonella sp. TaxID=2805397 RepID=UPI003C76152C
MLLLSLYAPFRKRSRHGIALMYHRRAKTVTHSWDPATESFEPHLKVLRDDDVILLSGLKSTLGKQNQISLNTVLNPSKINLTCKDHKTLLTAETDTLTTNRKQITKTIKNNGYE